MTSEKLQTNPEFQQLFGFQSYLSDNFEFQVTSKGAQGAVGYSAFNVRNIFTLKLCVDGRQYQAGVQNQISLGHGNK